MVVLAIKPKFAQVQEVNSREASPSHQQEKSMIVGKIMTQEDMKTKQQMIKAKDSLRYG